MTFLIRVALIAFAVVLPGQSAATDKPLFTIQTGTFVPREAARRQFDRLSKELQGKEKALLRVEAGSRYHTVRLGIFPDFADAEEALEQVRLLVRDAFILNEPADTAERLVLLFPENLSGDGEFFLTAGVFSSSEDAATWVRSTLAETNGRIEVRSFPHTGISTYLARVGPCSSLGEVWKLVRDISPSKVPVLIHGEDDFDVEILLAEKVEGSEDKRGKAGVSEKPREYNLAGTAGAGTAPLPTEQEQITGVLNDLTTLLSNEAYEDAVFLLEDALSRFPDNPGLQAWYGASLTTVGRHQEARDAYLKAAELEPEVPEYRSAAGYSLIYLYRENVQEAIEEFGQALEIDPDNGHALEGLGTVYVSIGETQHAREVEETLRKVDPEAARRLAELIEYGIDWRPE